MKLLIERKKLNIMDGTYSPLRRVSLPMDNLNEIQAQTNIDELDDID